MEWLSLAHQRLDVFLTAQGISHSRSAVQNLIREGKVRVNCKKVSKTGFMLEEGDRIELNDGALTPARESDISVTDLALPVLYEDDDCLVIDKPAGIAVHPGAGTGTDATLLNGLAHLFAERSLPFSEQAVLVHRLDKETTGALLIAKNPKAHHLLQKQFQDRTVGKTYLALVAGVPSPTSAMIDAPIGRDAATRTKMTVQRLTKARTAKTTYTTLSSSGECALLSCDLHTGRTHQLRVHLEAIGHPILGDPTYGSPASQTLTARLHVEGMCLHARKISFTSPSTHVVKEILAPLPPPFRKAVQEAGLSVED